MHNAGKRLMGWERRGSGSYYYSAKRVGGRVVKQYVGTGELARLVARVEAEVRDVLGAEAGATERETAELDALDALLSPLTDLADALARGAMVAAGFHRHHRGPWRRRRAKTESHSPADQRPGGDGPTSGVR